MPEAIVCHRVDGQRCSGWDERQERDQSALASVVYQELLSRSQAADMMGQILQEISDTFAVGENLTLSGFGAVAVRQQDQRIGRNPHQCGSDNRAPPSVPLSASDGLEARVNGGE
jgi:nucleoid DNA-binding protein